MAGRGCHAHGRCPTCRILAIVGSYGRCRGRIDRRKHRGVRYCHETRPVAAMGNRLVRRVSAVLDGIGTHQGRCITERGERYGIWVGTGMADGLAHSRADRPLAREKGEGTGHPYNECLT